MRTTIDMPDDLLNRVKQVSAARKTTFRRLVIDALERTLAEAPQNFRLRDAAAGSQIQTQTQAENRVSAATINKTIDEQRKGFPL